MSEFESFSDAAKATVYAIARAERRKRPELAKVEKITASKIVAPLLWPDKDADIGATLLSNCLNNDRRERLTPDQVMHLIRLGRQCGSHELIEYVSAKTGYSKPEPIVEQDRKDALMEAFTSKAGELIEMVAELKSLGVDVPLKRVA